MSSERISDERLSELVDIFSDHQQGALRLDSDTSLALLELVSLRAENERLTGRAELLAIEVEKQQIELTALRRPVEQSYAQDVRQYVSTKTLHEPCHSHFDVLLSVLDTTARQLRERGEMLEAAQSKLEMMTAYRDRLQAKEQSILDLIGKCDHYRAEIARLSSPPQERAEIVELVNRERRSYQGRLLDAIDTLLGDCAAWRNAHALVTAQLKTAHETIVGLTPEAVRHADQIAELESINQSKVERLEGALRMVLLVLGVSDRGLTAEQQAQVDLALAAADTQPTSTPEESPNGPV